MMALQAITIGDQIFERHKRSVDFIERYIFPGSCIPSITAISIAIARSTDLQLVHLEDITPHYARTLGEWRRRFFDNITKVRALGFSDTFIRKHLIVSFIIIYKIRSRQPPSCTV